MRAFVPGLGVPEDPVTGSLNAGIASWFFDSGRETDGYTVRQGTRVGADGLVRISRDADGIWVAGATRTIVAGTVDLASRIRTDDRDRGVSGPESGVSAIPS